MDLAAAVLVCLGIIVGYEARQTGRISYPCREGEDYYTCRSCEPTCDSLISGYEQNCSQACYGGCFCRNGLVRARDKTCVPPESCFRPTCQQNEEFNECGNACELNCSNINSEIFCTKPCYPGCFCKPDYVRDDNRRCILPSSCSNVAANQQCGINEQFVNCVSYCNTCWEMNNCRPSFCQPGCDCIPGYYRDYYGQCVTERQCYSSLYGLQNQCPDNEEYTTCVNPCNDCVFRGSCAYQYSCEAGCDCRRGFLRNERGICVPQQYCYRQECGENEIYLECGASCRSTCLNYRQIIYDRCQRDCVPGCHCQGNLVQGPDGKCIRPEFCPQDRPVQCPAGEQYYICVPSCRNTCDNINDPYPNCNTNCVKGCFCKGGLVRRKDGVCVQPSQCPVKNDPVCPPYEVYYQCVPTCRTTCRSLNETTEACSTSCTPGCFCQPGYVRNDDGTCVRPNDCKPPERPTCGIGEVLLDCLPCTTTCESLNSTLACRRDCRPGCACANGLVKRRDGLCVRPENCQLACGENEEWLSCGPGCPQTCSSLRFSTLRCYERCASGCFCLNGFVLGPDGTCIPPSSCPPRPCPSTDPTSIFGRRGESDESGSEPTKDSTEHSTAADATTAASAELSSAPPDATSHKADAVSPQSEAASSKPDTTSPSTDAATHQPDAASLQAEPSTPKPGAASPPPDSDAPKPDAASPKPDAASPKPDAVSPKPDAASPKPDATSPKLDAATPKPDAASLKPDATSPKLDAATPKPDAASPKPDATSPKPDAATPKLDATSPHAASPESKLDAPILPKAADDLSSASPVGDSTPAPSEAPKTPGAEVSSEAPKSDPPVPKNDDTTKSERKETTVASAVTEGEKTK